MFCPNCGTEVNDSIKFCDKCGTAIKENCPKCGAENPTDSAFCEKCGTSLNSVPAEKSNRNSVLTKIIIIAIIVIFIIAVSSIAYYNTLTPTTLTAGPDAIENGENYKVTLTDGNGNPIAGEEVSIELRFGSDDFTNTYTETTNENGIAAFKIDYPLYPNPFYSSSYTVHVNAKYNGGSNYQSSDLKTEFEIVVPQVYV